MAGLGGYGGVSLTCLEADVGFQLGFLPKSMVARFPRSVSQDDGQAKAVLSFVAWL